MRGSSNMHPMPWRVKLTITMGHILPPLLAASARSWIYPFERALEDDVKLIIPAQTGSSLKCGAREKIGYEFMIHGYWDWRVVAVTSVLCSDGDIIVECGANTGTETVAFSDIVGESGKVYAFEPFPDNFFWLEENINRFQYRNTTIFPLAISNEAKLLSFAPPSNISSGGGFLTSNGSIRVKCTTLDEQADRFGQVRLIHMDIEGAEVLALRGAKKLIKRDKPFLIVESARKNLSHYGFSVQDLYDELKEDYSVFQIARFGLSKIQWEKNPPHCNWLCIPKGQERIFASITKRIKTVGMTPCIPGINPISNWKISKLYSGAIG
jgi:FkbM family methyltransferase